MEKALRESFKVFALYAEVSDFSVSYTMDCIKTCKTRNDALKYIASLEEGSECIILSSFESIRIKTNKD